MAANEIDILEPGILAAARRFWWLPVLGGITFLALGLLATVLQPRSADWTAEASLVVQDPSTSGLFANSFAQPGRYVENQVAFLNSSLVAEQAAAIASTETGTPVSAADITKWLTIDASSENDVILLVVSAPSEDLAIASANAVSKTYQDVRLSESSRDLQASLDQLDAALAAARLRLSDIESQLAQLNLQSGGLSQAAAAGELLARLSELRSERDGASAAGRDVIDKEISAIAAQLAVYQTAQAIQYQDFTVAALTQEQGQLIAQVSTLEQRRDEIAVDSALAGSGVILDSRATNATAPPEPETKRNAVLGIGFGIVLGFGGAYFLALRRRRFDHRSQPEVVLGAPLLAVVPTWVSTRATEVSVPQASDMLVSDAHRLLASALLSRSVRQRLSDVRSKVALVSDRSRTQLLDYLEPPSPLDRSSDAERGLVIAIVSAGAYDSKSAIVADTGLACLISGADVCLVDADVESESVTKILETVMSLESDAVVDGSLRIWKEEDGAHLDLQTARGEDEPHWLTDAGVDATFDRLRLENDVILVDLPPVLSSAYATAILGAVDGAVAIIPHLSSVSDAQELHDMLDLTGTPVIGYVYSRAPIRRGLFNRGDRKPSVKPSEVTESD